MVKESTEEKYRLYLNRKDPRWEFGNNILYQMCKENPLHTQADVVVGKIWLIGRSYAAAIERRKNAAESGDDFYYNKVAPKIIEIGAELDERLEKLRGSKRPIIDDVADILSLHNFLTNIFYELTGLEKRSLASKYLHFHCPEKFFIYDSRAYTALRKLVKLPQKEIYIENNDSDREYKNFVCRILELQTFIYDKFDVYTMPRELDDFLLSVNT